MGTDTIKNNLHTDGSKIMLNRVQIRHLFTSRPKKFTKIFSLKLFKNL